jgi:hypothetical protein
MYGGAASAWQTAQPLADSTASGWTYAGRAEHGAGLPWRHTAPRALEVAAGHQRTPRLQTAAGMPWRTGSARRVEAAARHQDRLRHIRPQSGGAWRNGLPRRADLAAPYAERLRTVRPQSGGTWRNAVPRARELLSPTGPAIPRQIGSVLPWQTARRPPPGLTILPPIEPPIDTSCYTPPRANAVDLYLGSAWLPGTALYFSCAEFELPPELAIPYRRVYMIAHTITVTTYPGGDPVPLFKPTISTDADSYCWSLSATGPLSLLDQLAPSAGAPAQIRITVDGISWIFAIDKINRTRAFGQLRTQITGRSVTSALDDPWAARSTWTNTNQILAAQIVDQALDLTGITAELQVDDWLIPAGAWSHEGTPLSAVRRVAESIGAIVHSDPLRPVLQILPRYPLMPWEWYGAAVAPDVQLPLAAVIRDGYERRDTPAYNRAIVTGTTQGLFGTVTRAGTDGALLAPMVTEALATAGEAVLQRGRAVLGAAGPQALISLDLPVLTGGTLPGVLPLNALTEVVEPTETWRGMVRGVQVSIDGARVRQSVTLERHL